VERTLLVKERSFDSLRSLRMRILIGCVERSFPTRSEPSVVAMLLRTDSLIGCEERSFNSLRSLRIRILIGCVERSFVAMLLRTDSLIGNLVNNKTPSPLCFS
jgi:hypothetical protein